jgi:hypothetical protein
MKKIIFFFLLCITGSLVTHAQEDTAALPYAQKRVVIVLSTKSYDLALKRAKEASAKLTSKLDLRGLGKHKKTGLTWKKAVCETDWYGYPCYVARGRYDDGNYVSIEYSSAYEGFAEGYYIVVVSSGDKDSLDVKNALSKAKKIYPDAYAKVTQVYMGCMH